MNNDDYGAGYENGYRDGVGEAEMTRTSREWAEKAASRLDGLAYNAAPEYLRLQIIGEALTAIALKITEDPWAVPKILPLDDVIVDGEDGDEGEQTSPPPAPDEQISPPPAPDELCVCGHLGAKHCLDEATGHYWCLELDSDPIDWGSLFCKCLEYRAAKETEK